jgi:phage portal protein BeeE
MAFNFNISFGNQQANSVERDRSGNWFYSFMDGFKTNKGFKSDFDKINIALSNPAVLKVFSFIADNFSQVKINEYVNEKLKEKDFLYSYQKQPNPMQSWTQFHWDIAFWLCFGTAYIYEVKNVWYCLNPVRMDLTSSQRKMFQRLYFSETNKNKTIKGDFKYNNEDGSTSYLKLENLTVLTDLSNSLSGDWFKGTSRLEALYQVVINSDLSLTAKNRNLFFTTKFMISGEHNESDQYSQPMSDDEKDSVSKVLKSSQEIFASKNKMNVNQLVSNLSALKLDDSYTADLTIIANMYGINKDVLDIIIKGSTFENKEKSFGSFVDYTLMPKVVQLTDLYEIKLNKEDLRGSFKHLPFNQIFEAEKIKNREIEMKALKIAKELGMDVTEQLKRIYEEY